MNMDRNKYNLHVKGIYGHWHDIELVAGDGSKLNACLSVSSAVEVSQAQAASPRVAQRNRAGAAITAVATGTPAPPHAVIRRYIFSSHG